MKIAIHVEGMTEAEFLALVRTLHDCCSVIAEHTQSEMRIVASTHSDSVPNNRAEVN